MFAFWVCVLSRSLFFSGLFRTYFSCLIVLWDLLSFLRRGWLFCIPLLALGLCVRAWIVKHMLLYFVVCNAAKKISTQNMLHFPKLIHTGGLHSETCSRDQDRRVLCRKFAGEKTKTTFDRTHKRGRAHCIKHMCCFSLYISRQPHVFRRRISKCDRISITHAKYHTHKRSSQ